MRTSAKIMAEILRSGSEYSKIEAKTKAISMLLSDAFFQVPA